MSDAGERMKARLLAQFYDKPVIEAILDVLGEHLDLLDEVRNEVNTMVYPEVAVGHALDLCGEVADMPRKIDYAVLIKYFGFPHHGNYSFDQAPFRRFYDPTKSSGTLRDSDYRMAVLAKIAKNITNCSRTHTLKSLKRIFNTQIILKNAGNAKVEIGIGRILTDADFNLLIALGLIIRAAGVGVKLVYMFDGKPFGFTRRNSKTGEDENLGHFYTFNEGVFARTITRDVI